MGGRVTEPPDGFAEFVTARSAALLRAAWLLTGEQRLAEDLLQTALAASWRRWARVTEAGNPEAYVRRVLLTTYLSWWRRRWRGELPTAQPPERAGSEPDHATGAAERDAVRRALARLTRQQRAVVVLRYVEDLSVTQTAQLLGCSPQTVRVQASRALAALRADPDLRLPENREVHP
jgi:RNA polymerase sigma-70 factor (sigma-E family)